MEKCAETLFGNGGFNREGDNVADLELGSFWELPRKIQTLSATNGFQWRLTT